MKKMLGDIKEAALFVLATTAFAFLALGALAFIRPVTRTVADDINYQQAGAFTYSPPSNDGVYDSGSPKTGEPIFRQLANRVDFTFRYELVTSATPITEGTFALVAELSSEDGWKRTLPLVPETPFQGTTCTINASLDLNAIQALIDRLEKQTGITRSQLSLSIVPRVAIVGTLAGIDFADDFAPRLNFAIDRLEMQLAHEDASAFRPNTASTSVAGGSNGIGGSNSSPLKPVKRSVLKRDGTEPNMFSLVGMTLSVDDARVLSLLGLAGSLVGLLFFGVLLYESASRNEASSIMVKYAPMLLRVKRAELPAASKVIDLSTMDDLAKLADRDGRMILHHTDGQVHQYFVPDVNITYRYHTNGRSPAPNTIPEQVSLPVAVDEDTTVQVWSKALDLRHQETSGHTERVADMSVRLARELGMTGADLVHVRRGALLHDIGEMGIPDSILLKPGPLTDSERQLMRRHPTYAYELLTPIVWLRPALDIPYCHHERWDGSGYPRGLRGDEIPLAARVFSVVDVCNSLLSDRPYRPSWKEDRVRQYLLDHAGSQFDPEVVDAFLGIVGAELVELGKLGREGS